MVRISDNGPDGNKAKRLSSVNHTRKTIHHHHHNALFQGVKRLFVLAYFIADSGNDEAGIKKIKSIFSQEEKVKITTY